MKVLLINANRFKQPWPVIPFGLCCVAAVIEREGSVLRILDLCFSSNCPKDIHNAIGNFKPDIIGVSIRNIDNGTGYNTLFLLDETRNDIIAPCKRVFHGPIVIGGPAVGISGREMLDFFDLEYAIRGDGEACMAEFVRRVEKKLPLEGLEGLIIRRGGKIVQDPPSFLCRGFKHIAVFEPSQIYRPEGVSAL